MRKIIGLVGHPLSGKDAVAADLVARYNFQHVSTGDLLRGIMEAEGQAATNRVTMSEAGKRLRELHGPDVLVRLALEGVPLESNLVVSGLRALPEGQLIEKAGGVLVAVSAPLARRYERTVQRGRPGDRLSLEEFARQEKNEAHGSANEAQNVNGLIAMAEYEIDNSGDLSEISELVDRMLEWLGLTECSPHD